MNFLVSPAGIEPAAYSLGGYRSIRLSYEDGSDRFRAGPASGDRVSNIVGGALFHKGKRSGRQDGIPNRPTIRRLPESLPATGAARIHLARRVLRLVRRLVRRLVPRIAACGIMPAASAPYSRLVSSVLRALCPAHLRYFALVHHWRFSILRIPALSCLCFQTGVNSRFPISAQK